MKPKRFYTVTGFGYVAVVDGDVSPFARCDRRSDPGVVEYWKKTQDTPGNRGSVWGTREKRAALAMCDELNEKNKELT